MIQYCPQKIDFLHRQTFHTAHTTEKISQLMHEMHNPCYETSLRTTILNSINFGYVPKDAMYLLILGTFVLLFSRDVISKTDNDVKKNLKECDKFFNITLVSGEDKYILYHIKNSICHGNVDVNNRFFKFTDSYKEKLTEYSISKRDLIKGYRKTLLHILPQIKTNKILIETLFC